jgi:hypothetical protein
VLEDVYMCTVHKPILLKIDDTAALSHKVRSWRGVSLVFAAVPWGYVGARLFSVKRRSAFCAIVGMMPCLPLGAEWGINPQLS